MKTLPSVVMLTYCDQSSNLATASLTFRTLRTGFPNARVLVFDNASLPEARSHFEKCSREADAQYFQIPTRIAHSDFLAGIVERTTDRSVVFLDPDLLFWEKVEDWQFPEGTLAAGRLLPAFHDPCTDCWTSPRLHTSFLWLPDVKALRLTIAHVQQRRFEFDPWRPVMIPTENGCWERLDTGAALFLAFPEECYAFSEEELDAYDHLFCGTHLAHIARNLPVDIAEKIQRHHIQADFGQIGGLRGIWREQEECFKLNFREIAG